MSAMESGSMQTPRTSNKSDSSTSSEKSSNKSTRITLHDKKWTDGSISFDSIPDHLARLGKVCLDHSLLFLDEQSLSQ